MFKVLINANWLLKANKIDKDEVWIRINITNGKVYSNVEKIFAKVKLMYKIIKWISLAYDDQ